MTGSPLGKATRGERLLEIRDTSGRRDTALAVTHVLAAGEYGGLESVVILLAKGLAQRGIHISLVVILDEQPVPHPFEETVRAAGLEVHTLRTAPRAYLNEHRQLRELLSELRPDVVHCHGYRADIQMAMSGGPSVYPMVTTIHGFTGGNWRMRVYEALQIRGLRKFSAVVAVSGPIADLVASKGVPSDKIHVVRNAWASSTEPLSRQDARAELSLPPEARVVGWVGRLSHEKGADLLLEALAQMTTSDAMGCFLGDGGEMRNLRAQSERLGLADRVRWAGSSSNAARLFRAFDVYALSSRTEGTPMVLFEATAADVPIIATRVGGVPDVFTDNEAKLVEANRPDLLARALQDVLNDSPAAEQRATNARLRLQREFGTERWLQRYEAIYEQVRDRR
jgi:glycosyltransferase involved in cell wall biosynthesis